ncbi:BRO-N domain-containing protein [Thiomonas sp.]
MATPVEPNPIIRLDFEDSPILVQVGEDGAAWFAAKPLCTVLGFKKTTAALERYVKEANQQARGVPSAGGVQQMMHVNEAGMQALVSASHLVTARRFRTWIAAGVIHAAVRAVEAKQEPLLGDTLQGMTEFKPIEQKNEVASEDGKSETIGAAGAVEVPFQPFSKSKAWLKPSTATPKQRIEVARHTMAHATGLGAKIKSYSVIIGRDGMIWYPAQPICEDLGYTSLEQGLSLLSDSQMGTHSAGLGNGYVRAVDYVNGAGIRGLLAGRHENVVLALPPMASMTPEAEPGQARAVEAEEVQPVSERQEQTMGTEVMEFNFGGKTLKARLDVNGQSWFVASEVCEILGLGNPRQAVSTHIEDDDRDTLSMDTLGGRQKVTVVNESGLYALIVGSRKPDAKKFKKWVTSKVLPSIRKTGRYSAEKAPPSLGPIETPRTQERLQGAMDVARALIDIGESTLGREGLKAHIPHLSHPEVALGLAGLVLKNRQFLLTFGDFEHPVIRPLEQNEMIIKASGHEWIDKLLSAMNQAQLKAMAKLAMARID